MSISRKELNQLGCNVPDCGHDHSVLYIHSQCHPKAGCTVLYQRDNGLLVFTCGRCKKFICDILVAAELPPGLPPGPIVEQVQ